MSDAVLVDIEDGVATITLNEPDRRNAFSLAMSAGLRDALDEVEESDARCVVIEGAGDAFSAGGDVELMSQTATGAVPLDESVRTLEKTTSETMARVVAFPLPTVAKVDGPAVGAGANLATACDVQLANEDAAIGFVFREVGLAVDAGTSYLLPRVVGTNVAKELVFTGAVLGADRAHELGLVNHVYDADEFDEQVETFVERIATGPTVALRHSKRLIDEGLRRTVDEAMVAEATAQGLCFDTDDHAEGVTAFVESREPEFEGS
ncbi:enoyl-CoA hydratase/isomerase family protein [Haloarchaeobius baliensis]|uniref:enoyl-CoA hydratase/isomerase family protein n=1 Tax=Haloarchaeobius baliensis TaxID=1670458 RepID=UPI003F882605